MRASSIGCIWILITIVGAFSFSNREWLSSENETIPLPTGFSISEIFNPSLTVNINQAASDFPFMLHDNQVFYGHKDTLDCQFAIGGVILSETGQPVDNDIRVALDLIELDDNSNPGMISYAYPDNERGINGWSAVVVNWNVDYFVWLEERGTGRQLSPKILVQTHDCENNLAIVNFEQVSSMH